MLNLLFFGPLGEYSLGMRHQQAWSENYSTPEKLLAALSSDSELLESLKNPGVQIAINHVMGEWDSILKDGDEVAFLPPVSGG